jgi:hypothetical protein
MPFLFFPAGPASTGLAYALAVVPALFGMAGLHRMYLGQPLTGFVWFFTWGLCGIGTLYDLVTMQSLVDAYNGYDEPDSDDGAEEGAPAAVAPAAPVAAAAAPAVIKETIREVVKIRCGACGVLVDQGVPKCGSCGAPMS